LILDLEGFDIIDIINPTKKSPLSPPLPDCVIQAGVPDGTFGRGGKMENDFYFAIFAIIDL
jgi:hypothetical protein